MKGEVCGEVKKGVVDWHTAEDSGGERSSEVVRSLPLFLFPAGIDALRPSTLQSTNTTPSNLIRAFGRRTVHETWDAQQVPSWSLSRPFSDQSSEDDLGRVPTSPLATPSGFWSYESTGTSLNLGNSKVAEGQRLGMNRWKGDVRKQVSPNIETSESVVAKADSADSSLGSTLPKKSKNDFKLRNNQASKIQFKAEKFPSSILKQSSSLNKDVELPIDVQQDLHHIRQTILEQEAVFREQVRELHRVHKVQTHLLAEMKRKDSDLKSLSSRTSLGGPSQSSTEFASINSGSRRNSWNSPLGQALVTAGQDYETSISLSLLEPMKGGSSIPRNEADVSVPPQDSKLFMHNDRGRPARRTFDLERPPEDDDDDEPERKVDDSVTPIQANCIKFMESHDNESDVSLTLCTGWGRDKDVKDSGRDCADKVEPEMWRAPKRPREAEEVALFPFLATKSEALLRNVPLRPTPTVATQSFLEGLWGLHLWRKQLSGASTSEKDVLQQGLYGPGLRHVPGPSSTEGLERYAEGSSKKVSQASETVQGNGRSPLRAGKWIDSPLVEQDHLCSPGGINSSCKEDGTLVRRRQGAGVEQEEQAASPGEIHPVSLSCKDLAQPDAAVFWIADQNAGRICKPLKKFMLEFKKRNIESRADAGGMLDKGHVYPLLDGTLCHPKYAKPYSCSRVHLGKQITSEMWEMEALDAAKRPILRDVAC